MSKINPTPAEVQASLDAILGTYIDALPTPEAKATTLIKIGMIRTELAKYEPMLRDLDADTAEGVIQEWLAAGDGELKKMVWNSASGGTELTLAKIEEPTEGPMFELAKMVNAQPEGPARTMVVQHIGHYTADLRKIAQRIEGLTAEQQVEHLMHWVSSGDGTHQAMKKAVMDAEASMRTESGRSVGEKDVVEDTIGNASTHAGKLGGSDGAGTPDSGIRRSIPARSSGEGAGGAVPGRLAMPHQETGTSPNPGSGPNDTGDGGVTPTLNIKRKGTTGGMGSVRGADTGAEQHVDSAGANDKGGDGKKKKKWEMDKGQLFTGLMKFAPRAMALAISALEPDDQVVAADETAAHAADLMKWAADGGERLEKRDLDASITEWLTENPESLALKKWVAEALGTAEEIPLALAKAIMAWQPPKVAVQPLAKRTPKPLAFEVDSTPRFRLREPLPLHAA